MVFLLFTVATNAANFYSIASGNWNATSTWSPTSGGLAGISAPGAGDTVFIEGGNTVTLTADTVCTALNISSVSSLNLNTFQLDVSGAITMTNTSSYINVNDGALNAGSINFATTSNQWQQIDINTGTLTVFGDVIGGSNFNGWTDININAGGTLKLGGSFYTAINGNLNADTDSTVEYYGGAQNVSEFNYGNLSLTGTGTKVIPNAGTLTANVFYIATGVQANVLNTAVVVESLKLGSWAKNSGTWGGTGSGATNINNTFFAGAGSVSVTTDTRIAPTVTVTVGTYIYTGLAQGPNVASNLPGTSTSYTWSYAGVLPTVYPASATRPTVAGTYTATATVAASADGNYKSAPSAPTAFTIQTKALTITGVAVTSKVYDGGTVAVLTGGTLVGVNPLTDCSFTLNGGVFNNKNIGTGKTVTPNAITLTGADAANYTLTAPTGLTGTITAKALTITGTTVAAKVYDGNTTATISGQTLVGVVGAEDVTLTQSGTFDNKNIGTTHVVTSTSVLAGADKANYTLTQPAPLTTGTITPIALTVIGQLVTTKGYDGNTTAAITGGTLVGIILSEAVTLVQSGTFADALVGVGKTVTDTSVLAGADAGNYTLIPTVGLTGTITQKALTITGVLVTSKTYDGTTSATLTAGTLVGVVSPDDVTFALTGGVFDTKNIGTGKAVTPNIITLGGVDVANYTLTPPTTLTGTITAKALTIVGAAPTKVYDGLTTAALTGGVLTGIIGGENVVFGGANGPLLGSGTYNDKNVGTGKTVTSNSTITGADAGNYTLTQPTIVNGIITVASLAITANNQAKCFGTVKVLGTTAFTAVGLQNSETVGGVTLTSNPLAADITAPAGSNAPIVASAATGGTFAASNYSIAYSTGTLTVTGGSVVGDASSSPVLCQNTALTPITHTAIVSTGIGTATGLPAGVTAAWSAVGVVDGLITISGTPSVSGTFNYSIPVTGTCGGSALVATGTITVSPTLVASVSISPSASTVCNGITVTFTAAPTNGGTPTYQWYKGATLISGATASTYSYVPTIGNTDAINVVMTSDASPCLTANPATSNSITIVVNPIKVASVSIAPSANPICQGDSVTFTATPANGGTTPTYKWYNGATLIAGATASTYTYAPALGNTDSISVKMTSNASPCLTASPATSNSFTITVSPTVVASVTEVSGVLVSSALIGNQWVDCATDLDIPGATNQTYTPAVPGDYKVVVTSGGCTATSACTTVLKVNQFDSKSFTYYPNPVNSDLNLSYSKEITSVKVVNILGQVMSSQSVNATTAKVEMSSFPAGLYLVEVKSNDEAKTIKVMKN